MTNFKVGDVVRVVRSDGSPGDTRYQIIEKRQRSIVVISEIGPYGRLYAGQEFDSSLLSLEPTRTVTAAEWLAAHHPRRGRGK